MSGAGGGRVAGGGGMRAGGGGRAAGGGGMRLAARVGIREARRSPGRSALLVVMLALPVVALVALLVVGSSARLSPTARADAQMGRASLLVQEGPGPSGSPAPAGVALSDMRRRLPPGSQVLYDPPGVSSWARTSAAGLVSVWVRRVDLREPLSTGMFPLVAGRLPGGAGQVAVSRPLLARTGLRVGSVLHVLGVSRPLRIVGEVADPLHYNRALVVGLPGGTGVSAALTTSTGAYPQWLVGLPLSSSANSVAARVMGVPGAAGAGGAGAGAGGVDGAGAGAGGAGAGGAGAGSSGVALQTSTRSQVLAPYLGVDSPGPLLVGGGLAGLEVLLVAGATFAVGARRRERQLAVLAAAGATPRQVAGFVLAEAAAVGVTAALAGIAGGIGLAAVTSPLAQRLTGVAWPSLRLPYAGIAAAGVSAVVTALAAAGLPARSAARRDVVQALGARRPQSSGSWKRPALAVAAIAGGGAVAVTGAATGRHALYQLVLAGAAVAEVGIVGLTPSLVASMSRAAGSAPLALRLALRDAGRHRSRTAPAVSAVAVATIAAAGAATFGAGQAVVSAQGYQPQARVGQVLVYPAAGVVSPSGRTLTSALAALGGGSAATVRVAAGAGSASATLVVPGSQCAAVSGTYGGFASSGPSGASATTPPSGASYCYSYEIAVGGVGTLEALTGHNDRAASEALAAGKVVVFAPALERRGHSALVEGSAFSQRTLSPATVVAPVAGVPSAAASRAAATGAAANAQTGPIPLPGNIGGIVSPALARRLRLEPGDASILLTPPTMPTHIQMARLRAQLAAAGVPPQLVYAERGASSSAGAAPFVLAAVAALLAWAVTAVAVALAGAESSGELATMRAVGAPPLVARALAASQALVVAGLGASVGTVAGVALAAVLDLASSSHPPLTPPWGVLAIEMVAVPAVAALGAGLARGGRRSGLAG